MTSSFTHIRQRSRGFSYSSVPSAESHYRKVNTESARALMMMEDDGELDTNMDPKVNALGEDAPKIKELELGFEGLDIYPGLEDLAGDSSLKRVLSAEKEVLAKSEHRRKESRASRLDPDAVTPSKEMDFYPGLDELDGESSLKKVLSVEKEVMEENERRVRDSTASPEFIDIGSPGGSSVGGRAVLVNTQEKRKSGLSLHICEGEEDDGRRGQFSPVLGAEPENDLVDVPLDQQYPQDNHHDEASSVPSRPITPGSLFKDFDGIHCPSDSSLPAQQADRPPQARRRQSMMSLMPGQTGTPTPGMVYYPAPVPAVLNLPPRISKPRRESRNDLARRSVMPGNSPDRTEKRRNSVRASIMLDSAPMQLEKDSAVQTLDSILDASAEAPPVAFTEHPLTAAPVLSYSYRQSQMLQPSARLSTINALQPPSTTRLSTMNPLNSTDISPSPQSESPVNSRSASPLPPAAQDDKPLPTTLLAELESRKAQQRLRNRTAATVSQYGMRNTLLELDAVAQIQAQQRKNKRTHLAWEAQPEQSSDDDEDVPLAMLDTSKKADKNNVRNEGRKPEIKLGGLLMQKELEDTEPLSKRRTRLQLDKRKSTMSIPFNQPMHLITGQAQPAPILPLDADEEEETLGQRKERLKKEREAKRETKLLDLNLVDTSLGLDNVTGTAEESEEEETLGQRRERLRQEKEKKEKAARRGAKVSSTLPAGGIRMVGATTTTSSASASRPSLGAQQRQSSYGFPPVPNMQQMQMQMPMQQPTLLQQQQAMRMQMSQAQLQMQQAQMAYGGMGMAGMQRPVSGMPMQNGMGMGMMGGPNAQMQMQMQMQMNAMNGMGMGMGMNGMQIGMMPGQMQMPQDVRLLAMQQGFVPLNEKQRDMVERWRSSIV